MSGTPTPPPRAWWARRPPAAGAAVMATGIVSIGLRLTGYEVLSRILLVVAGVLWIALAVDVAARLLRDRPGWLRDAGTPGALTAVAATGVLGTRLSLLGWQHLAEALLALAALLWPVLIVQAAAQWRADMPGSVFLGCVATEGLAVLGATLAAAEGAAWLAHAAMVMFWLGLVLYAFALTRFDYRQVWRGPGDHWMAGGGLAISALAGSQLVLADSPSLYLWNSDGQGVLRDTTTAVLTLALAWYAVLLVAELVRPRPRYDVRRWATVFPMGMTAAAMLPAGSALDVSWLKGSPSEVLVWVSVAAWLAVGAGTVLSARRTPSPDGTR
ncbi:tellurite resistance/C4-dicarboxylate transporter family protein [Streptomyces sp. NPDC088789]|uniref:tellurite resistance/C4-dicarboxylate transporter family protein n=1 Tax=Streptomyces sp. NPDC088789 TaxID=3365899 RepID=UPI0037FDC0BE